MNGMFFANDEAQAVGTPETGETPANVTNNTAVKWTDEQQREFDRRAGALKKSAFADGERAAQKLYETQKREIDEAAEKKRLEAEGEYRQAYETAEKKRAEIEKRALEAEAKINELNLLNQYNGYITDNGIEFENAQARLDGFAAISSLISADFEMKDAFAELKKNRSYLFRKNLQPATTDARQRGAQPTVEDTQERKNDLRARFHISAPR